MTGRFPLSAVLTSGPLQCKFVWSWVHASVSYYPSWVVYKLCPVFLFFYAIVQMDIQCHPNSSEAPRQKANFSLNEFPHTPYFCHLRSLISFFQLNKTFLKRLILSRRGYLGISFYDLIRKEIPTNSNDIHLPTEDLVLST